MHGAVSACGGAREACKESISLCKRQSLWQDALQLLSETERASASPDIIFCNLTLSACEAKQQWQMAVRLLGAVQERHDLQASTVTVNTVLAACRASSWTMAVKIFRESLRHASVNVISYNSTLNSLSSALCWQKAAALLKLAPVQPDMISFNGHISLHGRLSHWHHALDLLKETRFRRLQNSQITYNASISALERGSRWESTLLLLGDAKRRSRSLNEVAGNSALAACERCSKWCTAVQFLSGFTGRDDLVVDVISFNTAISCCEKSSAWEAALALLADAESRRLVDVITYNATISACEKAKMWQLAIELLKDMQRSMTPDLISYNSAISACRVESPCSWLLAFALMAEAQRKRLRWDIITYSSAVGVCEKSWQWKAARLLLQDTSQQRSMNVIVLNAALCAFGAAGQWQLALWTSYCGPEKAGFSMDVISCTSCISACEASSQWSMGLFLLEDATGRLLRLNTFSYSCGLSGLAPWQPWQGTLQLLKTMALRQVRGNEVTYKTATGGLANHAQWMQGFALLALGDVAVTEALSAAISGAARSDDADVWPRALAAVDGMTLSPISFSELVATCEKMV